EIEYETDPSLIGGMVIRIKDRIVDNSVKTKLENITRDLHKIQI
ncbi:MAG: F0F1 ATP synthase subunit delta, partial [Lachnospiraceae bacterium]|nr:F0F1 ATP synthase subunit delta [Lachnospiraceae bacterium]